MISFLGVSKAVLDNVIFCHQEESNWWVLGYLVYEKTVQYHSNDDIMHAHDMLGFYHKEKHSILVCDLVRNVSSTQ